MDIVEPQWSETGSLIKTTAMDIVEPQRPESGSPIKTTAMDIAEPQRPESTVCGLRPGAWGDLATSEARIWKPDCFRNGSLVVRTDSCPALGKPRGFIIPCKNAGILFRDSRSMRDDPNTGSAHDGLWYYPTRCAGKYQKNKFKKQQTLQRQKKSSW